jgi:PhnB protein
MSAKTPQIIPYLFYDDVDAAIGFLTRAFGFSEHMRVDTPSGGVHAQVKLGDCIVMLGQDGLDKAYATPVKLGRVTSGVFVYLDEADEHYARAQAEGAEIVEPLADLPYGRSYTVRDPQGHTWFFTSPKAV